MKIVIVDYGVGNLKSLANTLEKINEKAIISNNSKEILSADFIILPGVGTYKAAVEELEKANLREVVIEYINQGRPMLGICVGMQILFTIGLENGSWDGLDIIKGEVKIIPTKAKIPHMGWNNLIIKDSIFNKFNNEYVYFVHSYYCETASNHVLAYTEYGDVKIPALLKFNNIYASQFHPEKSGKVGQEILKEILQNVKEEFSC